MKYTQQLHTQQQGKYCIATEESVLTVPEPLVGQALEGGMSYSIARAGCKHLETAELERGLQLAIACSGLPLDGEVSSIS
jgi:hypothetical protein